MLLWHCISSTVHFTGRKDEMEKCSVNIEEAPQASLEMSNGSLSQFLSLFFSHTHTHTCTHHTCMHTHTLICASTRTHHRYTHHTHTHTHHTDTRKHACKCTHTSTHTLTHTNTDGCTHTHVHTHTHTQTNKCFSERRQIYNLVGAGLDLCPHQNPKPKQAFGRQLCVITTP